MSKTNANNWLVFWARYFKFGILTVQYWTFDNQQLFWPLSPKKCSKWLLQNLRNIALYCCIEIYLVWINSGICYFGLEIMAGSPFTREMERWIVCQAGNAEKVSIKAIQRAFRIKFKVSPRKVPHRNQFHLSSKWRSCLDAKWSK